MSAKRCQPALGRRQRLAMGVLADHGVWQVGMPYGIGSDYETGKVMGSLVGQGLVAFFTRDWVYRLTMAGYAWLIREAADDLGMTEFGSDAAEQMVNRIKHLAQCARLTGLQHNPVNWRGEPV